MIVVAARARHAERAIAVVGRPQTERLLHNALAHVPDQSGAMLRGDETLTVGLLERTAPWDTGQPTETHRFRG